MLLRTITRIFVVAGLFSCCHPASTSEPKAVVSSSYIAIPRTRNQCRPKHVHMASGLSGPSTSMTITVTTDRRCGFTDVVAVLYGRLIDDDNDYDFDDFLLHWDGVAVAAGPPEQYNASDFKMGRYTSDYYHHVQINHLNASTTYRYQCVVLPHIDVNGGNIMNADRIVVSPLEARRRLERHAKSLPSTSPACFTTSPPPGTLPTSKPLRFALVGDLGQTDHSVHTVRHMNKIDSLAAIFHAGDLSYSNGNHSRWDSWFEMIEPLSRSVPWHVGPGNHELEIDNETRSVFVAYEKRFRMPQPFPAEMRRVREAAIPRNHFCCPSKFLAGYDYGNSYHAVTYGPLRAIFLNSYASALPGSKQYTWFTGELSRLDRTIAPWVIVIVHCPFYNTFHAHQNEKQELQMKQSLEPLMIKYRVNIVVAGHVHAYSRTKSLAYGRVDPRKRSPNYIVVGDGGNHEGHVKEYKSKTPEDWIEIRDKKVFGFGLLQVLNHTHATWHWVKNVDEGTTKVHDSVILMNQYFLS